jgi:hypothetical protein
LTASNPKWKAFVDELEVTGKKPRTNPDGDVGIETKLAKNDVDGEKDRSSWKAFRMTISSSQNVWHVWHKADITQTYEAFRLSPTTCLHPFLTPFKAKTRSHFLWRIDTPNHQGTLVSRLFLPSIQTNNISPRLGRFRDIEQSDKLFLIGTTLATQSAYR